MKMGEGVDIFCHLKKSSEKNPEQGETLAAYYNNIYLVVRRRNMNRFCDFYVRVVFGSMIGNSEFHLRKVAHPRHY